jgi:hypothetical protein
MFFRKTGFSICPTNLTPCRLRVRAVVSIASGPGLFSVFIGYFPVYSFFP